VTDLEAWAALVFDLGAFLGIAIYRLWPDQVAALVDRVLPYRGRHRALEPSQPGRHALPDSTRQDTPAAGSGSSPAVRLVAPSPTDDYARPLVVGRVSGRHAA
jgi:hypothetical protein